MKRLLIQPTLELFAGIKHTTADLLERRMPLPDAAVLRECRRLQAKDSRDVSLG
jgi:hypothetical protein